MLIDNVKTILKKINICSYLFLIELSSDLHLGSMFYILESEPSSFNNLIAPCNQITYLYSVGLIKLGMGRRLLVVNIKTTI